MIRDEFSPQMEDVKAELSHYTAYFSRARVLCNCGDGFGSNFVQYFWQNFNDLNLEHLYFISRDNPKTHYPAQFMDINRGVSGGTSLNSGGDFRSAECIAYLKRADIVVTSPPISLLRTYILQLILYGKKFIILGNLDVLHKPEIFSLVQQNQLCLGYTTPLQFTYPEDTPEPLGAVDDLKKHKKYIRMLGMRWLTNLDIDKRHTPLPLHKHYDPAVYPKYDNYDAIEVSSVADIPGDYDGVMGVPLTFLDHYCPEQFEILGLTTNPETTPTKRYLHPVKHTKRTTTADGFTDAAWIQREADLGVYFTADNAEAPLKRAYGRVLIRKKKCKTAGAGRTANEKKDSHAASNAAKQAKTDEFYVQYDDMQAEFNHYTKHFEGKTVLCNCNFYKCNNPYESNFCKFFLRNFQDLKLKRFICTSYTNASLKQAYVLDVDHDHVPQADGRSITDKDIDKFLHSDACNIQKLQGTDFIRYLMQADIVVTHPPFSQFREYVKLLTDYDKKFLILGNQSAIRYKEIFPLIKENKIWLGYTNPHTFGVPVHPEGSTRPVVVLKAGEAFSDDEGRVWQLQTIPGICWYTNLDIDKRHEDLPLYEHYSPEAYPKYDNYDAIEVSRVADIPDDYAGVMGVPLTFLDKYNPDQFEIIGLDRNILDRGHLTSQGKAVYARMLIRNKHPKAPKT